MNGFESGYPTNVRRTQHKAILTNPTNYLKNSHSLSLLTPDPLAVIIFRHIFLHGSSDEKHCSSLHLAHLFLSTIICTRKLCRHALPLNMDQQNTWNTLINFLAGKAVVRLQKYLTKRDSSPSHCPSSSSVTNSFIGHNEEPILPQNIWHTSPQAPRRETISPR